MILSSAKVLKYGRLKITSSSRNQIHGVPSSKGKGKAIPLQALAGPGCSRSLRLPDFKTKDT
jgi:hypothetical protein